MNDEKFREIVGIAIGRASVCWSELPSGVFDSSTARELINEICDAAGKPTREAELRELLTERRGRDFCAS